MRAAFVMSEALGAWVESRPEVAAARTAFDTARAALVAFVARAPHAGESAADYFASHVAARDAVESAYESAQATLVDARCAAGRGFRSTIEAAK